MAAARVSVGLPVYNGERFLADALDGLVKQTYDDLEIVVADNASTDRTVEIVRDFAASDARIRLLPSDRNRGAAWNYNRVFDACSGEFFRWHAHDDRLLPANTERSVEALDADPGAVLAHTYTHLIDAGGGAIMDYADDLGADGDRPSDRLASTMRRLVYLHPVFGLVRRDALARTARIAPFIGSDVTLLYELSLFGRFAVVPEHLFVARQANSIRVHTTKKSLTAWFDPDSPRRPPVSVDHALAIATAIRRAGLGPTETARSLAVLGRVWPVEYGRRYKRRRRRERLARQALTRPAT